MITPRQWHAAGSHFTYKTHQLFYRTEGQGETLVLIHMEGQSASNAVNTALPIGSNSPQGGSLKVTRTSGNSEKKKVTYLFLI